MVFLDDSKTRLWEIAAAVESELAGLRLRPHPNKTLVVPTRNGLDLLGYRVTPHKRWLRNDNGYRFQRRLHRFARGYASGCLDWDDFNSSVQSWIGHARQANTYVLRRKLFDITVFSRGNRPADPVFCAAAPGTTNPTGRVPPPAAGSTRCSGSTAWDSGSPGSPFDLFSLTLYKDSRSKKKLFMGAAKGHTCYVIEFQ